MEDLQAEMARFEAEVADVSTKVEDHSHCHCLCFGDGQASRIVLWCSGFLRVVMSSITKILLCTVYKTRTFRELSSIGDLSPKAVGKIRKCQLGYLAL